MLILPEERNDLRSEERKLDNLRARMGKYKHPKRQMSKRLLLQTEKQQEDGENDLLFPIDKCGNFYSSQQYD